MVREYLILGITLFAAACTTSGTDVSDQQIDQFRRGITTESEVITRLGNPTTIERASRGGKVDTYIFTKTQMQAKSFIPLIGPLIGGMDLKTRQVEFTFSSQGVLTDWKSSDMNFEHN